MKKYKITKVYAYSLTGIFEAKDRWEAEKIFDDTSECDLDEEYLGFLGSICPDDFNIEVLND